jgi:hypothetical protein
MGHLHDHGRDRELVSHLAVPLPRLQRPARRARIRVDAQAPDLCEKHVTKTERRNPAAQQRGLGDGAN